VLSTQAAQHLNNTHQKLQSIFIVVVAGSRKKEQEDITTSVTFGQDGTVSDIVAASPPPCVTAKIRAQSLATNN
jgi:hypothetical protein